MKIIPFLTSILLLLTLNSPALANETTDDLSSISSDLPIIIGNERFSIKVSQNHENGSTKLKFTPSGFQTNEIFSEEADGSIYQVFVSDYDTDGNDEFYFVTLPGGSGGYSNIIAFEAKGSASLEKIPYTYLNREHAAGIGYKGNDRFTFGEKGIYNSFQVYNFSDPNCCPTGGQRSVMYELKNKNGTQKLIPTKFWGNEVTDPGPKNIEAFNEALEYIQKMRGIE